ncbi:monocarboxylate transporter 12-like [Lineus longissimus]|uniref:monocarboxylate transporter 12-like n=1 Tax=Lineus longissimus TaxID=88925 RepID=UPI002B4CB487
MAPFKAPDGGWGWVVVFACFMVRVFLYGMTSTSGIIYIILLDDFEAGKAKTAIVGSLITASGFFIGTFAGGLVNKLGCRPVVILAGLLAGVGLGSSMFAMNVVYMIITYGVVTGIGFGMCYVPCSVLVSQYFDKKRNLALGLASGGGGLGAFLFPIILRQLIVTFGWRGTLLLCGGMSLNICVCGALMRPPDGYSLETQSCERKSDEESETGEDRAPHEVEMTEITLKVPIEKLDPDTEEPLLNGKANSETGEVEQKKVKTKKASFFYWDIFKEPKFIIFCVNNFLFSFAASVVYVHMMAYLKDVLDIGEDQSALLLTAMGATILVAKIGTGFLATHPRVDEHCLYTVCIFATGVATIAIPFATHFAIWVAYACLFGVGYATLGGCLLPALCVRYCGVKRLSSSYGALLLCEGVGHFCGAPCAGYLYQVTGVYANSFYLAGVVTVAAALLVIPPWKCMKSSAYEVEVVEDEELANSILTIPKSPIEAKKSILDIHKSFLSIYDVAVSREDLYKVGHHHLMGHAGHHLKVDQPHGSLPRARKSPGTPDLRKLLLNRRPTLSQSTESLRTKTLRKALAGSEYFGDDCALSISMPKLAC